MTKTEMAAMNRVYKRSVQALGRIADAEQLMAIVSNNALACDGECVASVQRDLALVKMNPESLRDRNRISR